MPVDVLTQEQRHRCMQHNKRKDTKPELILRQELRNRGYPGYRLQWNIPGRPDIAYPGKKIAIFVNGCFWHRCPKCNLPLPQSNSEYWAEKFRKNIDRDNKNYESLREQGWTVLIIWECEINKNLTKTIENILGYLD